ncbi:MAG: winged helix-turn-helix domain-containing protein [Alphaproteobacteria bacterium]|nr:winged helix-turn-helix domain-containing protein [Alphaproteobacteria bacterium]
MPLRISNRDARRLWLWTNGLADTPTGPLDLMAMIHRLGFVQIDTIRNVTRAHHHILWSRNQNYREPMLWSALKDDRALFEHFTHDASLIPMEFYPMWQRQFRRLGKKVARSKWYQSGLAREQIRDIRERIRVEGPLSTHAFDTKIEGPRQMWARPPHKKALDQMWYAGVLTTCHRENFTKFYDLAERVIPARHREMRHSDKAQIDWLCRAAVDRLSFASQGEVQRFWAAMDAAEVRGWIAAQRDLQPVEIENADKTRFAALAPADIRSRLANAPAPSKRLRILNPFDPAIRDRTRLMRLFGFDYRNEMFVPQAQRKWGYYVYPLLEGDRFVGRMEIKADRARGRMLVTGFWPEGGVKWSDARFDRLAAELARFGRLAAINQIVWKCGR